MVALNLFPWRARLRRWRYVQFTRCFILGLGVLLSLYALAAQKQQAVPRVRAQSARRVVGRLETKQGREVIVMNANGELQLLRVDA